MEGREGGGDGVVRGRTQAVIIGLPLALSFK